VPPRTGAAARWSGPAANPCGNPGYWHLGYDVGMVAFAIPLPDLCGARCATAGLRHVFTSARSRRPACLA